MFIRRTHFCPRASGRTQSTLATRRRALGLGAVAALFFTLAPIALGQLFHDVSASAGIIHLRTRDWGNPIWGDINNDGYLDLIVSVHELDYLGGPLTPFVYLNNKNGTFADIRSTAGLVQADPDNRDWLGFAFGDYDGDGNLDFFAAEPPFQSGQGDGRAPSSTVPTRAILYKGKGDGTFVYTSGVAGLETSRNYGECGFFVDYDNDGKLDLFVKNIATTVDGGVNVLYHNNGDGTFTQVANAAGLATATHGVTEGTICSFADYDNDGRMDVVIGGNGTSEALYRNVGGTFVDVTAAAGLTPRFNANGLAWGDYDNDGLLDLYVSRGKQSGLGEQSNTLYHNNGDGTFTDVTATAGVNDNTNTWAAIWGDYDNDGFLDLFVARPGTHQLGPGNANILYHNNGNGTFTDRAAAEGVALEDDLNTSAHELTAWGDYDNDGFLDLVIQDGVAPTKVTGDAATGYHYLLRNSGNGNHFIKMSLKGVQSNRFGIGARVTATYPGGKAYRENNGGGGGEYASQGSEPLHFGIGAANSVSLEIDWPSGHVDTLPTVAANSTITVTEGGGSPTPTPTPTVTPTPTPAPPVITKQPRPVTVSVGQTATFSVKATGTPPLHYQWRKNGTNITGATRSTYTTPPATLADNGALFAATVSDTNGSVTSNSAALKVVSAP
ncbi:MAG: VCBS repeat-containing protein [Chthoniobacterales bacterium]|nr:VCBS repeat-containing protein [Chthoniobacterales bacterium]